MRPYKTYKIDLNNDYPCPCRRPGLLKPILLTEALGCNRCQQIFVVKEKGKIIEQLSSIYHKKVLAMDWLSVGKCLSWLGAELFVSFVISNDDFAHYCHHAAAFDATIIVCSKYYCLGINSLLIYYFAGSHALVIFSALTSWK